MNRTTFMACVLMVAPGWLTHNVQDQVVQDLVARAADGYVRLSFTARPDVCGDGHQYSTSRQDPHWDAGDRCDDASVHVLLTKTSGRITHVRTYVGGRWRPARTGTTDVGRVASPDAARYLLEVARTEPAGQRAIMPATLADSIEVWPSLLEMARNHDLSNRVRRESMQWLGMLAGRELDDDDALDPERESRRQAIFALSQLPRDEGVPKLIDLVRTHRYDYVKRLALFWLGQSGDERALPVMQSVFGN